MNRVTRSGSVIDKGLANLEGGIKISKSAIPTQTSLRSTDLTTDKWQQMANLFKIGVANGITL